MKRAKVPGTRSAPAQVKVGPIAAELLRQQRVRFQEQFGRPPGAEDPVFFDPVQDEPVPLRGAQLEQALASMLSVLELTPENARLAAGDFNAGLRLDEVLVRAFRRAGRRAVS